MLPSICHSSLAQQGTRLILCCFKFNQDIIYLGYDFSRVVVHWSKPEPVRLLQILQMFQLAKTQEHSKYLQSDDFNDYRVENTSLSQIGNESDKSFNEQGVHYRTILNSSLQIQLHNTNFEINPPLACKNPLQTDNLIVQPYQAALLNDLFQLMFVSHNTGFYWNQNERYMGKGSRSRV